MLEKNESAHPLWTGSFPCLILIKACSQHWQSSCRQSPGISKYYCRCSARLIQVDNGCGIVVVVIWSTWMILTKRFRTCVARPWYISVRTSNSHMCQWLSDYHWHFGTCSSPKRDPIVYIGLSDWLWIILDGLGFNKCRRTESVHMSMWCPSKNYASIFIKVLWHR